MNTPDPAFSNPYDIEAYCMGTLSEAESEAISALAKQHPELRDEIEKTIQALTNISSLKPDPALKSTVLDHLNHIMPAAVIDLKNPPMINAWSDEEVWNKAIGHITATEISDGVGVETIWKDEKRELNIVWLYNNLAEEAHDEHELKESFFILEGSCECDFDGQIFHFKAGDYFDIPAQKKHSIKNTSTQTAFVKGLVQRLYLAV